MFNKPIIPLSWDSYLPSLVNQSWIFLNLSLKKFLIGFTIPDTIPPSYSPVVSFLTPITFCPTFFKNGAIFSWTAGTILFFTKPTIIGAAIPPTNNHFRIFASLLSFLPSTSFLSLFKFHLSSLLKNFPRNVSSCWAFSFLALTNFKLPATAFLTPDLMFRPTAFTLPKSPWPLTCLERLPDT